MEEQRRIKSEWKPADPEMVAVSQGEGDSVRITVKRAGNSSLQVAFQEVSRELDIKAAYRDNAIRVDICNKP